MQEDLRTYLEPSGEASPIRVLLVDDQAIIAEGVRRMLAEESDMEFHYCDSGAQALDQATRIEATIILQDLVMPDIDGITLLRFYRANPRTREVPVIMLSSTEDPAVKSEAFHHGANDYVVKLPDRIELVARIRAHSRHFQLQQERDAAIFALREMKKQLEQTNAELRHLSAMDGLTGINNRRSFEETLHKEWKRARRDGTPLSLILLDIDDFKAYNDTYGHQLGDDTLKKVATTLRENTTRNSDLVARYGGEEFALILPTTHLQGAMQVAERLREAVLKLAIPHRTARASEIVSISAGVATKVPTPENGSGELLSEADRALYQAKAMGRNRVCSLSDQES
ncbi:MAG TPA: diguanylate cyclase [Thiotrichales bacterium]|nr:diguanylate cyclase [Thiotrichales bacterium]